MQAMCLTEDMIRSPILGEGCAGRHKSRLLSMKKRVSAGVTGDGLASEQELLEARAGGGSLQRGLVPTVGSEKRCMMRGFLTFKPDVRSILLDRKKRQPNQ